MPYAAANPYPWPYNGDLRPENTALIVIDMQTDFCGKGGYIDLLGYDISNSRACIEPIQRVLGAMRAKGYYLFNAAPYALTLLIMVLSSSATRTSADQPAELTVAR